MSGKGSARRPTRLTQKELGKKWEKIFQGSQEAQEKPESQDSPEDRT